MSSSLSELWLQVSALEKEVWDRNIDTSHHATAYIRDMSSDECDRLKQLKRIKDQLESQMSNNLLSALKEKTHYLYTKHKS